MAEMNKLYLPDLSVSQKYRSELVAFVVLPVLYENDGIIREAKFVWVTFWEILNFIVFPVKSEIVVEVAVDVRVVDEVSSAPIN